MANANVDTEYNMNDDDDDGKQIPLLLVVHRSLSIDPPHVTSPALKLGQIYG